MAGCEQAALASYWMDHRPEAFRGFHVASGAPSGYAARLDLRERDAGVDRGVDAMW
ncbi:hypothetical protein [Streptomyces malaysiensis]|uniref:hypothetical protein n=1 Tax=Streptomyces malaysiensis TaxID=92644 RepID=UPI00142E9BCC|nr:hypothetical protein [Streptomyces malaysiensis]